MYRDKRVAVVVAAGGAGVRMGADAPKQFMRIGGKSVLERTTEAFENNASVDDVYVVTAADRVADCRVALGGRVAKLRGVCTGGATRQASVFAGLSALPAAVDIVLIHDAARPFVSQGCIDRVLRLAAEKGAAAAAVPVKDTIKAARDGVFAETLDRSALYRMQTPQGFRRSLILEAHAAAVRDGFTGTDDAVLLERIGEKVYLAEGDYDNIKLTTPEDIAPARAIAARADGAQDGSADMLRIGNGYDAHRFSADRRLVLGGVDIPHARGLLGRSDADALTHALIDALLGAAALGDIGGMFPDTDARYEGISSLLLLGEAFAAVRSRGYALVNADATVVAERPRLAPYIEAMRERLADAMGAAPEKISIKATTTEGLGFAGREEGVAAFATVLLSRS
ncbi:MAG: 2-C-methyl-D-erythritol 4-phosphate cytidylyltransferase [Clostridiales Family XIII bacterium]|jgi:2-C-methyl-D-erythritol 4-phosphate cytidylyltransferase/2-C-methyl-D-erythritol 2,4-cyclodiphosphate synthase|nr:2-C-methyl-D-erythritol 4-phosphate cytidylyltransferase [Clostridiales Family XIII bacterium]